MVRYILAMLFCVSVAVADDKAERRKDILKLLAECEAEAAKAWIDSPEHFSLKIRSARFDNTPTEKCYPATLKIPSFQFVEQKCREHFEEMIELLQETAASDLRCDHEYLAKAITRHARIKLEPVSPFEPGIKQRSETIKNGDFEFMKIKMNYSKQISEWYKNRHTVPKRFEAAYQNYIRTQVLDKGIIATSTTSFDTVQNRIINKTEPTGFGKALDELRSFGLDALPECVERFEKADYRLCWLFTELTDRRADRGDTLELRANVIIRWWRNTSEHAEALMYTLPALDAGKDFKFPEKQK